MYSVYVIQSATTKRFYVGYTSNLERRLDQHNSGVNRSTRGQGQWVLVRSEVFLNKKEAWKREHQIKKYKGGNAFKKSCKI